MSDLLNIGASGIRAYRTALATVGENVANAETAGYTRREVRLREAATVAAKDPYQVQSYRSDGVSVMSLQRVWDDFTAADARMASADASRAATRAQWMQQGEAAIDDGDSGVGAKLTAFFNAATTLSSNPGGSLPRGQMLGALDQAAGQIRSAAAALTRVSNGVFDAANVTAESINDNLQALGSVNLALNRATKGSVAAANLADQRDQLLDELSAKIAVDTKYDDKGAVTVTLAGSNGTKLVERGDSFFINVERASDGRLALSRSGAEAVAIIPTGGSMAGLIDATAAIAGTRNTLDGIARDFKTTLNAWNAQGTTPAGAPGGPLLTGDDAATLSVPAALTPDAIAARSADGKDNGNLTALSALRGMEGPEARVEALIGYNAQALRLTRDEAAAATSRRDLSFASRDAISGVDLNKEAADLLRFQQAYDGSARILQVGKETIQTILQLF